MASNRNVAFVDGTPNSWPIPVVLCSCCGNEISRFEGAGPDELKNLEDKNIEARKRIIESKGAVVNLNDLEKEGLIILCSDGSIISDDFQEAIQRGGYGLIRKEIDSTENLPAQSAIFVKLNN